MGFLKALFGGGDTGTTDNKKNDNERNFDLLKYDGVKAMRMGQADYAIKCFREALNIKEDLETRDYLATTLVQNNELMPAYEQLDILSSAVPDNIAVLIQKARIGYMMEDYEAMLNVCKTGLALDSENTEILVLYAKALIGKKDMITAIAMLTKAITIDKDLADAYLLRAQTLLKMGDIKGADQDAEWLLSYLQDNEDVLLLKARIELASNHPEEAVNIYNKVIEVNPFSIDAFKERGQIKYDQGDKQGAEEDMQKVLELNPDNAANINGEFSAEGIEEKIKKAYSNINPLGL